jgi:hypothetical protein
MLDLNPLFEFSTNHCVAICAFLVPANLIAAIQILIFVGLRSPKLAPIILMSVVYALTIILHVVTWFLVGVVMAPTFILLGLGVVCLGIDIWAVAAPINMSNFLRKVVNFGIRYLGLPKTPSVLTK